jgi:DNA-binding NarL/FixJ family response regulator
VIRVVIADDHGVVRQGLTGLLESAEDLTVVGVASDGGEAIVLAREHRPDVVLMDLQMPGVDGVEATRTIVDEGLGTEVLVLTSFSDHARIHAAIDAGAVGYLLKDADPATSSTACARWPAASPRWTLVRHGRCSVREAPRAAPSSPRSSCRPARRRSWSSSWRVS